LKFESVTPARPSSSAKADDPVRRGQRLRRDAEWLYSK
jgi:hypothetical protein